MPFCWRCSLLCCCSTAISEIKALTVIISFDECQIHSSCTLREKNFLKIELWCSLSVRKFVVGKIHEISKRLLLYFSDFNNCHVSLKYYNTTFGLFTLLKHPQKYFNISKTFQQIHDTQYLKFLSKNTVRLKCYYLNWAVIKYWNFCIKYLFLCTALVLFTIKSLRL